MAEGCPFKSFDPFAPDYVSSPYDFLARARAERPVFFVESLGLWLVTTYKDVKSVLSDPAIYSSANAQWPLQAHTPEAAAVLQAGGFGAVPSLTSLDGPQHARLRKHFASVSAFLPSRMDALRAWIAEQVDSLIDGFIGAGRADLVKELTAPLPARVVYRLIGFPESDSEQLQSWCVARLQFNWARPESDEQVAIAHRLVAFWKYTERFVAGRREDPRDDYASDLVRIYRADPTALTLPELTSFVYGLTFAGQETTVNLMGSMLRLLLTDRAQWDRLVKNPDLVPNAVEEALRLEPPIAAWRRMTTRETELGGVRLPKGAQLLLHLGSAGHDSAQFSDGERLDVGRPNARTHLAFGFGAHFCLGSALARLESALALRALLRRIPDLRLGPTQHFAYTPNLSFRGPAAVFAEWTPGGS